jgi:CzcA family heavy metal efflux pump
MLSAIVRFSIRQRGVVVALAFAWFGYGVYTLQVAREDVFPEFAPPLAQVQVAAPGMSAGQVEVLVTQPIENALGGLIGVKTMRSKSLPGLSMLTLTFDSGVDVRQARQAVAERLGPVGVVLPAGVKPPTLLPLTSSTSVVMDVGLTSTSRSLAAVHEVAEWTVKPRLLGLPGVADVVVFGGDVRELQVQVDPDRLEQDGLTLQDLLAAARRSTGVRSAGFIEGRNQRLAIRTEGQLHGPAELAQIPIAWRDGLPLRLGDVATVGWGSQAPEGAASIDGRRGVMLVVESQYGADATAVTREVDRAFAAMQPLLAAQQFRLDPTVFRPAAFIGTAMGHLRSALLLGGALVIAVLLLFLFNLRTALISACAIPLSLLSAVIVLHRFGVSLNVMTLGGLAIALGEVVDDAIVDVENILRRLRANRRLARPLAPAVVIWRASIEVRSAVVYASFIVVLVFVPVLGLSGVAGKLFGTLAEAYMLAVLASLGVALTLTPALASVLLEHARLDAAEPRLVQLLKAGYARCFAVAARHAGLLVAAVVLACGAALASLPLLRGSFIPALKEDHYTVHMALAPGTSLAESMRVGDRVTAALRAIPGVRRVAQRAGRAGDVVDPVDVNVSEFEVDLAPLGGAAQSAVLGRLRAALARFPGMTTSVNTFLAERIDETISGDASPVVVDVHGDDLDVIDAEARQVMAVLERVPGAIGVGMRSAPGTPELQVRLRAPLLQRYALRALDVLDTVQAAFAGVEVAQRFDGNRVSAVVVTLDAAHRRSPADIGRLRLRNAQGLSVPLSAVADIREGVGRSQITHQQGQRVQVVTSGVRGRSVREFVADAQARLGQLALPRGTYLEFAGEARARARSQQELLVDSGLALGGIALLLMLALRNRRSLLLVMLNLPFALVGGVAAVLLGGADLSLGSLVGFATLFGITLRNAIMLVSHYEHLVGHEAKAWGPETALRGASERLVPILMTASVTALGLLPLAMRAGEPGNEVEGPMAIVILGGLFTSTLLNLLVLPALALRFGRFAPEPPALDPLASTTAAP